MTAADAFPGIVGVLYLVAAFLYARGGQPAMSALSLSYAVASAAMVWVGVAGRS